MTRLTAPLALALSFGLFVAACDQTASRNEDDISPQPWVTHEPISGVWDGENVDGLWLRVEIGRDSAKVRDEIGTITELLGGEGGNVRCKATLFAREADPDADPPIYRADYKEEVEGPCWPTGTLRMKHQDDSDSETLVVEYKPEDENNYLPAGTLTREGS